MKKISRKMIIGIAAGVAVIAVAAVILITTLRIDAVDAREIAWNQTGGGDIIREEISREGILSEFSYAIVRDDQWYEIEIDGFGRIEELSSGTGQYVDD